MPWNPETQTFDPPHDWPIEREDPGDRDDDGDATSGLVTALICGGALWGAIALAIWEPWTRRPLAGVAIVYLIIAGCLAAHTYLVEPWRRRHADCRLVDWLRRSGL